MSSWIKLSDVGAWLDRRYNPYCRVGNGWGPSNLYDTLAEALRGGSVRARGTSLRSRGRQVLIFMPDQPMDILPRPDGWDVSVAGVTWWGVEVEADGLERYCDDVLDPPASKKPAPKAGPGRTPIYDWPAAYAAISTKDTYDDFAPDLYAQSALATIEAELKDWFALQGPAPSESLIRTHAVHWRETTAKARERASKDR